MKASEFRRWLKQQGCTFENHRSGSGHVTVRRDGLVSQLPIARSRQGHRKESCCEDQEGLGP